MPIIKPTHEDIPQLLTLWEEQFNYHYALDSIYYDKFDTNIAEGLSKYLQKIIQQESPYILAAKIDDKLSGFILFNIETDNFYDTIYEHTGVIMELYVKKEFRGKGIGVRLIKHAENNYFSPNGITQVRGMASTFNESALTLYERLGYTQRQTMFYKMNHKLKT